MTIIVEKPDENWKGPVGLITKVLEQIAGQRNRSFAREHKRNRLRAAGHVQVRLQYAHGIGIPMQKMFVSLERRMHCGMGKCCRCNVGSTYTCLSGPVFDYWTVMNLKEAI